MKLCDLDSECERGVEEPESGDSPAGLAGLLHGRVELVSVRQVPGTVVIHLAGGHLLLGRVQPEAHGCAQGRRPQAADSGQDQGATQQAAQGHLHKKMEF